MKRQGILLVAGLLLAILALPLSAQGSAVTITLAVNDFMAENFQAAIDEFQLQNPDIKVQLVQQNSFAPSAANGIDSHLENLAEYAASADVLLISQDTISLAGTRAGYFLDLSPLTSTDSALNPDDFYPAAWQSFQWDRGVWALPLTVDVYLLIYDPAAFDEAGLPYPSAGWTLTDFANAIRELTTTVDDEITGGYFDFGTSGYLWSSLLASAISTDPTQPLLNTPEIEALLTTWQELREEGAVGGLSSGARFFVIGGGADDGPPLSIQRSFALAAGPQGTQTTAGALLPGGHAGIEVQGVAVSAGTLYPEAAYRLARFLTSSSAISSNIFGSIPARRSLQNAPADTTNQGGPFFNISLSPENQALVQEALSRALPASQTLFTGYLNRAVSLMGEQGLDTASALREVEAQAISDLQTAASTDAIINVATPVPEVVLAPGEIELKFGMVSFIRNMDDNRAWDAVIQEFVNADPQVGSVKIDMPMDTSVSTLAAAYDCFYLPTNQVSAETISSLIPLDPFLDADPNFNASDVIGNALDQVKVDSRTWALPITIQPEVLRYNADLFVRAGVPLPENGWNVDSFADALRRLWDATGETPFVPRGFGGSSYILGLITAYGGLPLDPRTNPATISFTDSATVDAIRQVLDLAKAGLIDYSALFSGGGGGAMAVFAIGGGQDESDAIYTHSLNALNLFGQTSADSNYRLTTYPTGTQYTPLSYDLGTGYISAGTQNPEACYRWLQHIAQEGDLFSAMPALQSQINTMSPELAPLFNQIDHLLSQPNLISQPRSSIEQLWATNWLYRAFDRYVLEDADLESELALAEQFSREFQTCAQSIPEPEETGRGSQMAYFQELSGCASAIDPTIG